MRKVFVDTFAWIALINANDAYHKRAKALYRELNQQGAALCTTDFVLLEVADGLCVPRLRVVVAPFIDSLRESDVTIIPVGPELLDKGWSLYSRRPDKGWGLTDCTSFVVMEELGLAEAFTSDQHFTQAGYQRLL